MATFTRRAGSALLVLLVAGGLPRSASGWEGLTLRADVNYTSSEQVTTGPSGSGTQLDSSGTETRLYLTLRQDLAPLLRLYADGTFARLQSTALADGVESNIRDDWWRVYGRLTAGEQVLNGNLSYERAQDELDARAAGTTRSGLTLVRQTIGAAASWRPRDLPRLDLRAARSDRFDPNRIAADTTSDTGYLNLGYDLRHFLFAYNLSYNDTLNRLGGSEQTSLGHSALASWTDQFLEGRIDASATYRIAQNSREARLLKAGATVEDRVTPYRGLSATETFPALPSRITLSVNGAVIDGDTAASAGLNLGYGPTLAGDTDARDIGLELVDSVTPVNALFLFVDRTLTAGVASALTFTAWQSADNLNWTQLAVTGLPTFDAELNRFAIPVAQVEARYLKVVVQPLAVGVTTNTQFLSILVTELQAALVTTATSARTTSSSTVQGTLSTALRVDLIRSRLSYDFQGFLSHRSPGSVPVTYAITNGLSLAQPLGRTFTINARLDRTDADSGRGHEALLRYSAEVAAQPIPEASATLGYYGQNQQTSDGTSWSNAVMLFGRMDPYRGINLNANLSYQLGTLTSGAENRQATGTVGFAMVPHRSLTLNGSASYSEQRITQPGPDQVTGLPLPDAVTLQKSLNAGLSWAPLQMLFLSGTASRVLSLGRWYTLLAFNGSLSPLSQGELVFSAAFTETLDTSNDVQTRQGGPYLRWNFRKGSYLEATYSWLDSTTGVTNTSLKSRAFNVRLSVPL